MPDLFIPLPDDDYPPQSAKLEEVLNNYHGFTGHGIPQITDWEDRTAAIAALGLDPAKTLSIRETDDVRRPEIVAALAEHGIQSQVTGDVIAIDMTQPDFEHKLDAALEKTRERVAAEKAGQGPAATRLAISKSYGEGKERN